MGANVQAVTVRFDAVDALTPVMQKMKTGLGQFSTTLKEVRTSTGQVIGTDFTGALTRFNQPMAQANTQVTTFASKLKSLGSGLAQNATSFGVATASIWGVYNAYDNLVKVQIRAESASNRVRTMTTTLHALEERRRIGLEKGNLTAEQVSILDSRIADTKAKLATAQLRETDLQGDLNEAWANFATTIGPQVVAAGGSIVQMMNSLNVSFSGKGGIINAIKNGFMGLIPGLKAARAESMLLRPALGGIGAAAAAASPALSGMTDNLGKAEKGAGGLSNAVSFLKGNMAALIGVAGGLGGALLILDVGAKAQAILDKMSRADVSKRTGLINAALGDPEQIKIQTQQIKEYDTVVKGANVAAITLLWDAITGSNYFEKAAKGAGLLDKEGKVIVAVSDNAAKASPSVNKLATSTSALTNQIVNMVTAAGGWDKLTADQIITLGQLEFKYGDVYQASRKEAEGIIASGTAAQGATKSTKLLSESTKLLFESNSQLYKQQLMANGQFNVTAESIAKLEQGYVTAGQALATFTKIDLDHERMLASNISFNDEYVKSLESQNKSLRTNAIALGAGSGALSKFGLAAVHTSGDVITSSEGLRQLLGELVNAPGIIESAKDAFVNFQVGVRKTADENIVLRQGLISSLSATHDYGELVGKTTKELQEMYTMEHDVVAAEDMRITKMNEARKAQQELFNGISDLANEYQVNLNPALITTQKQLAAVGSALGELKSAQEDIMNFDDLLGQKVFKLDFELDKEFESFIKDLPKGLRGKVKLAVESEAANKNTGELLALIAKSELILPIKMKADDKEADKFAQDTIDAIKAQFKQKGQDASMSAEIQGIVNKILEIKKAPDTWTKLTEYFQSAEFLGAIGKISPQGLEILKTVLGDATPSAINNLINQNIVAPIKTALSSLWKNAGVDQNFFDAAKKAGGGNLGLTGILLPGKGEKGKGGGEDGTAKIQAAVTAAQNALTALRTDAAKAIVLAAPNVAAFAKVFTNLGKVLQLYVKAVDGAKTTIPGPNPKPFASVMQNIAKVLQLYVKAVDGAKTTIPGPNPKPFATVMQNIANVLKLYIKAVNSAKTTIPAPTDKATPVIKSVLSGLKSIDGFNAKATVNVGLSGPGVKFLQHGYHGVVDEPTVFIAGEAGPEKVDVSRAAGPATGLVYDRPVDVNRAPKIPTMPREPIVPRTSVIQGGGPIHVTIPVTVYLTEGLPAIKKFVKDIVLEDVGMFPTA